jgi:23S rRNA (guanosine2251-2'-O)-methyltransferase
LLYHTNMMSAPKRKEVYLILHNIRSVYNVGSAFRTADAAGVTKLYLTGYTPIPVDRFGKERRDLAKVALGAEKTLEWQYVRSLTALLKKLKKDGIYLIAVEQNEASIDYKRVKPCYPCAIIVGNEVEGVPQKIVEQSDVVAEIPMRGTKESLNVSVALGVVLFRILNI